MTILLLDSGYRVRVRPCGPFAFDHITRRYPDPEPVMREVKTELGDVIFWPYEPPDDPPDPEDRTEWLLWAKEKGRQHLARKNALGRSRETAEFFLLDALDIVGTPHALILVWIVNAIKWLLRLFGLPVEKVFLGERYLTFLKTRVIVSNHDWIRVQRHARAEEVTTDDVLDTAVRSFRDVVGRGSAQGGHAVPASGEE